MALRISVCVLKWAWSVLEVCLEGLFFVVAGLFFG